MPSTHKREGPLVCAHEVSYVDQIQQAIENQGLDGNIVINS
ncbi:hypothetical protein [Mycolicibacterium fortuitum]|nr:hypothetical protein [Mycolicibacterium fortuitum]